MSSALKPTVPRHITGLLSDLFHQLIFKIFLIYLKDTQRGRETETYIE